MAAVPTTKPAKRGIHWWVRRFFFVWAIVSTLWVADICRRHKIDPVFFCPSTSFDYPRCFQVATVLCHSNCRADKTDLCLPEWVYEKIEEAGIRVVS